MEGRRIALERGGEEEEEGEKIANSIFKYLPG